LSKSVPGSYSRDGLAAFIAAMPKAELHLHLDGALEPAAVAVLAARHGVSFMHETDRDPFQFRDFAHFVGIVRAIKGLLRTSDDFAFAIAHMADTLAVQHVRYAEVTLTPYSLIDVQPYGLTCDALLAGLDAGRAAAAERGVELAWVFDIPRNRAFTHYHDGGAYVAGAAERTLDYALAGMAHGVVGLGLGGSEVNAPPEPFAPVFAAAKRAGLKSVPHAGESAGPASIWGALDALGADRIGHGLRAAEDPVLVAALAERGVPLEVSMTCNVRLGFAPSLAAHPAPALHAAGCTVVLATDDPALVGATLNGEYAAWAARTGASAAQIAALARGAFACSAAAPALKARLLAEFDAWAAAHGIG
jgi:aminodeoxyfutalosine deaminase